MTIVEQIAASGGHTRGAGYDLVLLAHVLAALVGFGAIVLAGGYALSLRRPGPVREPVRRYYRPGVNWAGRILFLVPVLGVVLMAMSQGDWSFSDRWITIGLGLWALTALVSETVLWPAERRLQEAVAAPVAPADLGRRCLWVAAVSGGASVVLVAATVVMVAKP